MDFNLADLFECVVDHVAERDAVVSGSRRLTYGELDERANRFAHGLSGAGIGAGDHVGLYLYNSTEFLEAMLGCFKLRAVPINVNYRYVADELAHLVDDADLRALVYHGELRPHVEQVRRRAPRLLHSWIEVGPDYERLLAAGSPTRGFEPRSGDDHYVLYTGGTTGLPKGVVWRQRDIFFASLGGGNPGGPPIGRPEEIGPLARTNRAQRVRPFLPDGDPGPEEFVALSLGPLMHASGQWLALGTLLGGGRVVLYEPRQMDMDVVLGLIEGERITMVSMVGDASAGPLLDALDRARGRYDTSSLRLLGSGGSILSASAKSRLFSGFAALLAIIEAIGSSEAPVQGLSIARRDGVTTATMKFEAKDVTAVLDENLQPVEPGSGAIGRLATRGLVPLGYYKDPAKSARTFVDIDGVRWSLPGDMATVERDGTIRLLGRGAMCINTGGEKVYPDEVEAVLKEHPAIADALVIGVPHPRWGEQVVAVVAVAGAQPPDLAAVQDFCRSRLAGYKLPRRLCPVAEVRRGPAGKGDYRWARGVALGS